jgi:hypothetical protein
MAPSSTDRGDLRLAEMWYLAMPCSGTVLRMLNKRKAAIGYATYLVVSRVAKRVVRRKAREMRLTTTTRPRRRLVIPLVGGAAAAVAGAAVLASRHRTAGPD